MKVLIYDEFRIQSFKLPDKIEGFYTIKYSYNNSSYEETITLEASEGNWLIKGDYSFTVKFQNAVMTQVPLKEYYIFELKFQDMDKPVKIQAIPTNETFSNISVSKATSIYIGKSSSCSIYYNCPDILDLHANISLKNNLYNIQSMNSENYLYVNEKRVMKHYLEMGDVISIYGLKIIWMGTYIKINNPNNKVFIKDINLASFPFEQKNTYTPITEIERNIKLYNDNQLFFHTPRLKTEIKEEKITIETPPEQERNEQMPIVLTLGTSAIIGITSCMTGVSAVHGLITKQVDLFNAMIEFVMCGLMLIACVLFPMLTDRWQKNKIKKKEELRQKKYGDYLLSKEKQIDEIIKKQKQVLNDNNYDLENIIKNINDNSNIWSREILDNDFLTVRLGIGNTKAKLTVEASIEQFSLYDDNLKDKVKAIKEHDRLLENVPITLSLVDNKITPFIINTEMRQQYINGIMLQLLYYYSGIDLKIIVLTNENRKKYWNYIKYLPHNFSNNREKRLFAVNENEYLQLSSYLEQIYDNRINESNNANEKEEKVSDQDFSNLYKNYSSYYLIITDDYLSIKSLPIINRILNSNANIGFSLMIIESSLKNLPSRLQYFVNVEKNSAGLFSRNLDVDKQVMFKAEYFNGNIANVSQYFANIPLQGKSGVLSIPTSLSFLQMYNVGRIDQLNVLSRWKENNPTISLHTPIGIKENDKLVELDLHEKYHGPHGLIAGSTGSGKSEFIITYILSLAINYSPDEVQFVLIDYKGGGLAGAFENRERNIKIPHLVGTITNLDKEEMNRTLVSIKSELQRRQKIFNETRDNLGEGTIDIYKYQLLYREGKVKTPLAHLFVISDEFAELKDQQPDFMDELISTARIGRSLGVHLILATQKPSGVVNDQIWSNSRFHICLKVQTTEDSIEMLKKPDAANLKEAGRFYLQVGNDELFELGQSSYSGVKYIPQDRIRKKIDDSIDFIENDGTIIKKINNKVEEENTVDLGEQLTNIVKYLYDLAIKENIPFKNLWLPSIPNLIYLPNVIKDYKYQKSEFVEAVIGIYDKPEKQEQGLYKLDLTCKNTILFGLPGSGKENYLTTLIYSSMIYYTPNEVNFYVLDFGAEALGILNRFPHVGDVLMSNDKNKIATLFESLEREIRKRKDLFSEYQGSFINYNKNSGSKVPLIITLLNGFESFMENCGEFEDYFIHLLREGSKYGIEFVTTVISTNSIRSSLLEYFSNKIIMQTSDEFDYRYMLGADQGRVPKKVSGRGMTILDDEVCEFQTSYIDLKENINNTLKEKADYLMNYYKFKVSAIKVMPKKITTKHLMSKVENLKNLPLGYNVITNELTTYDFTKDKINFITGNNVIENNTFFCSVIDLIEATKSISLTIIDFLDCIRTDGTSKYVNSDYINVFNDILNNNNSNIYVIIGIGNIDNVLTSEEKTLFNRIITNVNKFNNSYFILIENSELLSKFVPSKINRGIWQGDNFDEQEIFNVNEVLATDTENSTNFVYIVEDSNYEIVKTINDETNYNVSRIK